MRGAHEAPTSRDSRDMAQGLEPSTLGAPDAEEFTRTRGDVEHFRQGDQSAFDRIWQRYRPALELLIAARVIPKLEPDLRQRLEADDILQTAAITIREKLDTFEYLGPGSVLAWMTAIVMHVVSDMIRYWRADLRDPMRERPADARAHAVSQASRSGVVADHRHGPATNAHLAELRGRVGAALAQVSERHQTIVIWRFFGAASWDEVAAEVGSPSGAAVRMEFNLKVLPQLARLLPKPD